MKEICQRLLAASSIEEARVLLDRALHKVDQETAALKDRRALLRAIALGSLAESLLVAPAIDHLLAALSVEDWRARFGPTVEKELPGLLVDIVADHVDAPHTDILRLIQPDEFKTAVACIERLGIYLDALEPSQQYIKGMRVAMIFADLYGRVQDPKLWRRRAVPECTIDNAQIRDHKQNKKVEALPLAYLIRVNQLQRMDLRRCLQALHRDEGRRQMITAAGSLQFEVRAPLRIGLSSANASDNHARSKEQGGKTLNAGIDLQGADASTPRPPLHVEARRLSEPRLVLRARSADFDADFEADTRGNPTTQSELFFAYRRGGDASLRMVKQALVHTGIIQDDSTDIVADIARFTDGGGLEITTTSAVLQGSGLGTSSVLAAAILKVLYRLCGDEAGNDETEYPSLYDQSVLLEQSIGLNSGWQDARGACGGSSAVKDFFAPATDTLPTPQMEFIDVDEDLFHRHVVLFDTGIARSATRGLNVLLETYLSRDRQRYAAIRESLSLHDYIVEALRQGDYPRLGQLSARYWELRCTLDPGATNGALQQLFAGPLTDLHHGGMLTGAGGGGFALLIAREGEEESLRQCLTRLKDQRAYAGSAVVTYQLNRTGLHLTTTTVEPAA